VRPTRSLPIQRKPNAVVPVQQEANESDMESLSEADVESDLNVDQDSDDESGVEFGEESEESSAEDGAECDDFSCDQVTLDGVIYL